MNKDQRLITTISDRGTCPWTVHGERHAGAGLEWHRNCTTEFMSKSSTLTNTRDTREIQPDEWIAFLAEFTRENRGAHARLEIIGPIDEVGYQVETEDRPFEGVSADTKDRERSVWITFGTTPEDHLTHGVHNATLIRLLLQADRAVLEVEASDGTKNILELTSPETYALPPAEPRIPPR